MEKWLQKHLEKPSQDCCYNNDAPISLVWENEMVGEEMPVLRSNWIELQAEYQVYWTQLEIKAREERIRKWASVFTSM